ncbi:hypothetical protein [Agrobacterium fabrum]|uniref:hypothetical protein n=1 Tax=Agrobacterium fabrum TaxID=1176649 RepID=UPI000FB3F6D5|nr:hypothetical protein [Agrobacterium fabrum]WCK76465.1 hypothetical protein G6L39_000470 [Agrobacterium fabrum]
MLEEASWVATIIGVVIAFAALFWAGKTILKRTETRQDAKISGRGNTVNQSSNIRVDK